ncbi:MAG TPA: flagellar biosynthesis anti-sigma factor FlgM [Clostridia bacterium]|nr:flagellar biosynthesis anti-sigma factor FlgM [Clostridia bacterium]
MKIWGDIPRVSGVYDKQKNVSRVDKTGGVSSKKDVISISNQAKDFQTVMKAARDVPDIRTDIVNDLSAKYESGKYDVNGNEIADKVLKSIIDQKV